MAKRTSKTSLILLFTVYMYTAVSGDYELQVKFYRFDNPNQRCEECHLSNGTTITGGCCDDRFNATGDQCSSRQCEMYFTFCHERPLNTSSSSRGCPTMEIDRRNNLIPNTDGVSFRQTVLGIRSNPVIFRGYQWVGTQFYMEFKDRDTEDTEGPDDLIDTLAVDVDIPVGASINRTTYTGRFNNAQIELSFRVVCAENYTGPDCTDCNGSSCPCDPGFTGELCETNCTGVNCSGNGKCVDGNNSFVCECDPGFTGELCETNINDCEGVNCSGNGKCVDGNNSFVCECDPGFTGEFCETNINDCEGVNCSGNGKCVDGNNSFVCECDLGFTGDLCETDINFCEEVNCSGNGQCIQNISSFSCQCNSGFTGALCDTSTCDCGPNGQCVVKMDTYTCDCDPGFTGEDCEQQMISVCENVSCSGNGHCEESENGATMYRCICDSGFTGTDCETIVDSCSGVNCEESTVTASNRPTMTTKSPQSSGSLGVIIGGAVGGAIVILFLVVLLVLIIIVCLLKRNIRRMHYNVEDVMKTQSITPGDNPVYAIGTDEQKLADEERERELHNPIYDGFNEHEYETTTFTSTVTEERKFDNPIYDGVPQNQNNHEQTTNSASNINANNSRPPELDTNANSKGILLTTPLGQNPICSVEEGDEIVGRTNPLFTQHYDDRTISSPDSSCELEAAGGKQEASCSLVKSSIYDEDFLKPDFNEEQGGNEIQTPTLTVENQQQQQLSKNGAKQSYRRQDYEDIA